MLVRGITSGTPTDAKVLELKDQLFAKWVDRKMELIDVGHRIKTTNKIEDLTVSQLRPLCK